MSDRPGAPRAGAAPRRRGGRPAGRWAWPVPAARRTPQAGDPDAGGDQAAAAPVSAVRRARRLRGDGGHATSPPDATSRSTRSLKLTAQDGTFEQVAVPAGTASTARRHAVRRQDHLDRRPSASSRAPATACAPVAVDADGVAGHQDSRRFRTQDLTLDQQTYPSFAPLAGETVGVGMPVIVRFDVPVTDKAAIEKHLRSPTPRASRAPGTGSATRGALAPAHYWKPGTDVTVERRRQQRAGRQRHLRPAQPDLDVPRRRRGDQQGQRADRPDEDLHQRQAARTIPITTGKPGFTTRSGHQGDHREVPAQADELRDRRHRPEQPDAYDIDDVEYAMRVTYSGEFLHAAPWSVGSQGYANVSHGCTGMSTANAAWLYNISKPRRRRRVHRHRPADDPRPTATATGTTPSRSGSRAPPSLTRLWPSAGLERVGAPRSPDSRVARVERRSCGALGSVGARLRVPASTATRALLVCALAASSAAVTARWRADRLSGMPTP